jgi:hypothetical protein
MRRPLLDWTGARARPRAFAPRLTRVAGRPVDGRTPWASGCEDHVPCQPSDVLLPGRSWRCSPCCAPWRTRRTGSRWCSRRW